MLLSVRVIQTKIVHLNLKSILRGQTGTYQVSFLIFPFIKPTIIKFFLSYRKYYIIIGNLYQCLYNIFYTLLCR